MSAESKRTILNEMSDYSQERIVEAVRSGLDGKLNGDNVDIYVHTNDIRMNNSNRDYHFFASDWTPYRIKPDDLESNQFLKEKTSQSRMPQLDQLLCPDLFKPNTSEIKLVRNSINIIVGRILKDCCKCFHWMNLTIPKHMDHPLCEIMARKTESFQLPIMLKNESKYDDCIHIMEDYIKQVREWYTKAGRGDDLTNLKIPVGGDQLTRVRLDGAKSLRAGAHTADQRLENLYPVVVELFHTLMDFVEKAFKTFMKKDAGRDVGTLGHLKILIRRSSVNGNVKSRFKAHEDFFCLVGKGFLLEAALKFFGMDDVDGNPSINCLPENIDRLHKMRRTAVFDEIIGKFVDTIMGPCSFEEEKEKRRLFVTVNCDGHGDGMECQISDDDKVVIGVEISGQQYELKIPVQKFEKGQKIKIIVPGHKEVVLEKAGNDDLYSYASFLLHIYLLLMCLKDAISEGDIIRINALLKFMIPFFYSHSALSKYFVECLDYIMKTELILPPLLALNVRTSSLVNPHGGKGNNRPADLQKENQVKELKELIKSLGANKTENSIIRISKSAPVVTAVVDNFDNYCNFKSFNTNHKTRNDDDDLKLILSELRKINPFSYTPKRKLDKYANIPSSIYEKLRPCKILFEQEILKVVDRLRRNVPVIDNNDFEDLFDDEFEENDVE